MVTETKPFYLDLERPGTTFLFPIYGLQLSEESLEIRGWTLTRIPIATWMHIEKSAVNQNILARAPRSPIFAICRRDDVSSEEGQGAFEDVALGWSQIMRAMRLLRHETLLDPIYTARYFASGVWTRRMAGLYRQAFLSEQPGNPYRLEQRDLPRVDVITALVERAAGAGWSEVELMFEGLEQRFAPHMDALDAYGTLCGVLESLFGRFRDRIGGLNLAERAERACRLLPDWFDAPCGVASFLAGPGRELRNIAAHGADREPPMPPEDGLKMLTDIVRASMACYLAMRASCPSGQRPFEWFNTTVSAASKGDAKAIADAGTAIELLNR